MYEAENEFIYYCHPDNDTRELFITIHPTEDCPKTPAEQAIVICDVLNDL